MRYLKLQLGMMPTNSYIFFDEITRCAALFDPAANAEKILRAADKNAISIDYVFLTHGHADHIGALNEIKRATGARVCVFDGEKELLYDPKLNYSEMIFGVPYKYDFAVDVPLHDGECISVDGIDVVCRHTPGHTAGSCIYLIDGFMVSGDTLFKNGFGRTDLYSGSFADLRRSLSLIARFENDYTVLPGHGETTSLSGEKDFIENI